ncbi:SDR family oxidoreductase [Rhizorhabdus argentea]|uniref:SDR family oxidoreductase n=1 Tax=Rhizorhabdus argentea TaxID=1387174 RepID=UPI0030EC1450
MKISGNTVLITGGTSGIGFELARQLSERRNRVIITGRDEARLENARITLPGVSVIRSDVSDPDSIQQLHAQVLERFPDLNMLVNNAGIQRKIDLVGFAGGLADISTEIDTNLRGSIRMVMQFLPHLLAQPNAAIVNVTSALAFVPFAISPIYGATKAGLHSFTQALRAQTRQSPLKVFELAPPAVDTPLQNIFNEDDLKGNPMMDVTKLVRKALEGIEADRLEITPGASGVLRMMSRLAPGFILKQLSKPVAGLEAARG